MGFFYADAKREAPVKKAPPKPRLQDIPVTTLRSMGCKVCPRDSGEGMRTPKMRPEGGKRAPIYLLGTSPSREDDDDDVHWADEAMGEVYQKFGKNFMRDNVRSSYTVQCFGEDMPAVTECCRGRAEADIAETAPRVVVTVGDAPLRWATGITGTAPQFRGQLFVARIGGHVCWVYPIVYPNYAKQKSKWGRKGRTNAHGRSAFEVCIERDLAWLKDNWDRLPDPVHYEGRFDAGIECITGDQPGDLQRLERALVELAREPHSALDIETNGLRARMVRNPKMLTAAVGTFERTVAFPLDWEDAWGWSGTRQRAWRLFAEYLAASGRKACHNLAMEHEWIEALMGPDFLRRTEWDDTMAMAFVLDGRPGTKGLDIQTQMNFGFPLKDQSRVDVRRDKWWTLYPLSEVLRYNGMDTKWTDKLRRTHEPALRADPVLWERYEQRVRLAPALVLTEAPGLLLDVDFARELDDEMRQTTRDVERRIAQCDEVRRYERKYGRFQPGNPDDVLRLMRDLLERPEVEREDRATGLTRFTTDEEALNEIPADEVPSAALILEHREVTKLHGTYVQPALAKKWVGTDGRVRSKYSSMTAVTWRLSSEDPNVQNFPKRKHKRVRGMIVPGPGRVFAPCDYGQIEFRVVGMASGDDNLVRYCWTGYDVHKYWAERMIKVYGRVVDWIVDEFGDSLAEMRKKDGKEFDEDKAIVKLLRQEAKNKWVFPQLFGSTTRSCARNLHLPEDVADELGGEFWDEFRGVKKWQEEIGRFYERHLYVETLTGGRRRGAMTANEMINMPIQGTAADIVQEAQIALSELADQTDDWELQPVLNVHDDLTFDLDERTHLQKLDIIVREMCRPRFDFINVPLVVEASVGTRWDNAKEIGVYRSHELFGIRNPYEERK